MTTDFSLWSGLAGGLLIGLSAALMILFNGSIAGISGIVGGLLKKWDKSAPLGLAFLIGILAGGILLALWQGKPLTVTLSSSPLMTIAAGLLIGFGSRLGGGCTSGHGICGMARLSPRSIAATLTFMVTAAVTVYVVRHVVGA